MCFIIHKEHQEVRIAEEDIICYKRLEHNLHAPYQCFRYELDRLYSLGKPLKKTSGDFYRDISISEGFHSYSTENRGMLNKWASEDLYQCIIPKDTSYYYNPSREEYVSDQIIIKEKIEL